MRKKAGFKLAVPALIAVFLLRVLVFAQEQPVPISAPIDQPDAWAVEAVEWSYLYGLMPESMYSGYKLKATRGQLSAVCVNLYENLTGTTITPVDKSPYSDTEDISVLKAYAIGILTDTGEFDFSKETTRMETVAGIYNTLKAAQSEFDFNADIELNFKDIGSLSPKSLEVVKYAVSKGILSGRNKEIVDLDSTCTRQELMIFAKNTYEFAIYESGRDSKGAFWRVNDGDSIVYLLGSIHLADSSLYPLSKDILEAYEQSDALVVEADITNMEEAAQYMMAMAMYQDGNTLEQNIPEELYNAFVEVVEPYGIPKVLYNKFKPWYAALFLQNLQLTEESYSAGMGVDMFFLTKAEGQKDILEIEGIKFQVDLFDSFTPELQGYLMYSALETQKAMDPDAGQEDLDEEIDINEDMDESGVFDYMLECWKTGNTQELAEMVKDGNTQNEEEKEFNEKIWTARDSNMADKIREFLADPEGKTYFVVVGAGHMVGETGIVSQLEDEYEIEQIK